jgi:hypothetical protein
LALLSSFTVCCRAAPSCPKPVPPAPVTIIAEPIACNLPALPSPITRAIGFPSPDGQQIFVSVTDFADLGAYVLGLHQWIEAAAPCITGAAP